MKRFILSDDADHDLQEIKRYLIREGGTPIVRHIFARLKASMVMLAANPYTGHSREDLTNEPVKFWPVFSYLIVYDPETKPIGIARVLQGNQDLKRIFLRSPPRF